MKQLFFKSLLMFCGFIFTLASCDSKLVILGENSSNLHAFETLKEQYEKETDVNLSFRPNTFEEAIEKAKQDFKDKTGIYDIVLQYNFSLSSYVRNNYIWDLDSLLQLEENKESFSSFVQDSLFVNAWKEVGYYFENPSDPDIDHIKPIGFPFATNTMLLVYNKRMFEDADNKERFKKGHDGKDLAVPETWEDFKEIAKFFTTKDTYGVCMQGAGVWLYYEYCDILFGMDGSIFDKEKKKYGWDGDKDTPIIIDSQEAIKATELYRSLKPFNKGNYFMVDATEQVKMILEGDVAMGLVWSDYLYGFVSSKNRISQFGFAPLPGTNSPIAGGCFYVNRNTKHPKEAIDFILYMMQPEIQVELALHGLCSPLRQTYHDENVRKKIPYADALYESLDRGGYMFEAGLESDMVSQVITNHIQRLWGSDSLNVESVLQQIKAEIEAKRKHIYNKMTITSLD